MCDFPNIPSPYCYNKSISDKILKHLIGFLKRHSDNNIITIKDIKKQPHTSNPEWHKFFDDKVTVGVLDRLIIECHCINQETFKNKDCIEAMVNAVFNPLIGVSDIKLVYSYSMYCCRD